MGSLVRSPGTGSAILPVVLTLFVLTFSLVAPAQGDILTPSSYDMIGGGTSSPPFNHRLWDEKYPQTSNYQPLSGGLGDLTDGLITTSNWTHSTDYIYYVGWYEGDLRNPTIDFYFSGPVTITDIGIHFNAGYVPGSVHFTVGSTTENFDVDHVNPGGGAAARWVDFALTSPSIGDSIQVTLNDRASNDVDIPGWPTDWILLTEVQFEGSPVPIPGAVWLLGSGLIGLVGIRRKFDM